MKLNLKAKPSKMTDIQKSRLETERISYSEDAPPARQTWKERAAYDGDELSYRGQVKKTLITLKSHG
ncbi:MULTISPECIES: hypothetical protein [Comamonas]|jgi:hypothetical protein|uniref:Uncharacterized protein n=1 Tax=Comamonas squillarum TaxID=2977320 RepID=A0ABY6A0C0_9BURK|nr:MULTISPECIES: hypothetical protein [Comamonas]UXC18984.1 hypothetical protein N4T19_02330 [Comamonas sp. PR12]